VSEGERLPKLKENSKPIKLKDEINGLIGETFRRRWIGSYKQLGIYCNHNFDTM